MRDKLKGLITEYLMIKQKECDISPNFIDYLLIYTQNPAETSIPKYNILKELKSLSLEALNAYSTIKNLSEVDQKIIYFIIQTSKLRKHNRKKISKKIESDVQENICSYIKKGALGFKIGFFNDTKLFRLKELVDLQIYEIIFQAYQNGNIYKKLKNYKDGFYSKAHVNFYELVKKEINLYEKSVIDQDISKGVLGFHLGMWKSYLQLQFINQLNECFKDNPKNPFKFLKLYEDNFNKNVNITTRDSVILMCSTHINDLVNTFINTGKFRDQTNEFFIIKNQNISINNFWDYYTIDYGLVPYFMTNKVVEKILYIGKCLLLINKIKKFETETKINILDSDFEQKIDEKLKETNEHVMNIFIEKEEILNHIQSAKDIFLFGRADFIDTLLFYMKDYNKLSNKIMLNRSMSYILEKAILNTFKVTNKFTEKIDICILDNERKWDYISLYCQLEFPANIIFTKEIIMKYVTIFKFLWRVKKIEILLKQLKKMNLDTDSKIRIIVFLNIIYKMFNYFFEEVIEPNYVVEIDKNSFMIDELRKKLNNILDLMIEGIFQNVNSGKEEIDVFLESLENMCLSLGRSNGTFVQDQLVRSNFKDFVTKMEKSICETSLKNFKEFI